MPLPSSDPKCVSVSLTISSPLIFAVESRETFKKISTVFLVADFGIPNVSHTITLISNSIGLGFSMIEGGMILATSWGNGSKKNSIVPWQVFFCGCFNYQTGWIAKKGESIKLIIWRILLDIRLEAWGSDQELPF